MIARNYINNAIPQLKPTDRVDKAVQWMEEYKIAHLPVVEQHQLSGIVSENVLLNAPDYSAQIATFSESFLDFYIKGADHIFEAFRLVHEHKITIVPVVQDNKAYEGLISLQDMVEIFSEMSAVKSPGAILILHMKANDYSLAQISRIVENNGAKLLSSFVITESDPSMLYFCMKLNKQETGAVTAALERFEYTITGRFTEAEEKQTNQDNLDQFFKYLDI